MEQTMLLDSNVELELQIEGLITPSRAQKRLFIPSSNNSKRSLFQEVENPSDVESDLGPMSPLALTDYSSCDSSPGRQFVSPLATPEKSPMIPLNNWERLVPYSTKNNVDEPISPFSSLRKVTRSARFSPRQIFPRSPKSKSSQSTLNSQTESNITTPDANDHTVIPDEVVPETPGKESDFDDQQSYVEETPQKEEFPEYKLITPLGSVYKNIPIPKIHRRKSLGTLDFDKCTSPEIKKCNTLKRNLEDSEVLSKYQKTDEFNSVSKARAALFQDVNKNTTEKKKDLTLNTKSFYGSSKPEYKSVGFEWREPLPDHKKRRSLPVCTSSSQRRSLKKHRKGEINCGVGHGIKKPKPKRKSLQNIQPKSEKKIQSSSNKNNPESKENLNPLTETVQSFINEKQVEVKVDPNKKFFKFKPSQNTTVTVNNKLKLKAYKKATEQPTKKPKLDSISFDATDLSVDEPAVESSLNQTKVNNILKILENDWADDDYDEMDITQTCLKPNTTSPKKFHKELKHLTMSPGSELSNMASSMNIEDISAPIDNSSNNKLKNINTAIPTEKFYPLFSKGYAPTISDDKDNPKKRKRSNAWQLSTKYGNADDQYQIDAGQKMFGATQCNECGIIYHIGDAEDENAHLNYHNSYKILKFQGWKSERVLYRDPYTQSRIILIEPKDSNLYWKKVTEVLEVVDRDLGLSDMKLSFYRDKRVLMYVRDKTILGVLVAEYVKSAFRMIPELVELNCCTSENTSVKCGVNVVWTAMSHRRQGIATKLVDALRANYYYGYIMTIDDIAFSIPTPSGKLFAEKYTKTRNYKVY